MNTRLLLAVIGLVNAVAAAALAYEAADFSVVGVWRFVLVLVVAGCGFLLINLRSWRDADQFPERPITHTVPQHDD